MGADAAALTLRQARERYFARQHLGDGGYADRWVKLQAGPIPLYFPNTRARVRAVKLHDLHHLLTAYDTSWRGEAEIGAWEIASGCGRHYPAWVLNLCAVAVGLVIAPRAVHQAFLRGCYSGNLYCARECDAALLERRVGEVRHALGLDRVAPRPAPRDHARFAAWAAVSAVTVAGLWAGAVMVGVVALAALVRRLG
ncbi:MAG TPA: hypothetical protein VEU55_03305 [Gemmatimonadales bacterium]|nr:hypothetical protein [Gemmatimonadales bacterium]